MPTVRGVAGSLRMHLHGLTVHRADAPIRYYSYEQMPWLADVPSDQDRPDPGFPTYVGDPVVPAAGTVATTISTDFLRGLLHDD